MRALAVILLGVVPAALLLAALAPLVTALASVGTVLP